MPLSKTVDLDAAYYSEYSAAQKSLAHEFLSTHCIQPSERILDVGCGEGAISAFMVAQLEQGEVLGIDPSPDMIAYARTHYASLSQRLSFLEVGVESFKAEQVFSLATAFNCLHWVRDLGPAFQNIYTALCQTGRFLGLTYPLESVYWQAFIDVLERDAWAEYQPVARPAHFKTSEQFKYLLEAAGFQLQAFESLSAEACYQSIEAFSAYANGWLACLLPLGKAQQVAYLAEVATVVKQRFSTKAGIVIPYTQLQFCAVK